MAQFLFFHGVERHSRRVGVGHTGGDRRERTATGKRGGGFGARHEKARGDHRLQNIAVQCPSNGDVQNGQWPDDVGGGRTRGNVGVLEFVCVRRQCLSHQQWGESDVSGKGSGLWGW